MVDRNAPVWVRALAAAIPRMPVGRYWMVNQLRRVPAPPFMMRLPDQLGGFLYHCDQRDSVAREACYTGQYEPQETQLMSGLLRPDDVFVDVGANWGYFSLVAAHRVGPRGCVIAFEPEPRLYRMLLTNIAANEIAWIDAQCMAIAAGDGWLSFAAFREDAGNWGDSRAVADEAAADFKTATRGLDTALDAAGLGTVRLVKVDVEGSEVGVLAGMQKGLAGARYDYVLLECHPALLAERGESAHECVRVLLTAGYRVWTIAHSAAAHRRAARGDLAAADFLEPYTQDAVLGDWPHVIAAAPDVRDPA